MRVSAATGSKPPNFVRDNLVGAAGGGVNPGHRLAADPTTGYLYDLWQNSPGAGDDASRSINYHLNRSTDGGQNWTLNGSGTGFNVATADSDQPTKFGTVNALLGGVDSAAVDPTSGDVYYVYGNRDAGTNQNRLSVARLQSDGTGTQMNVAAPRSSPVRRRRHCRRSRWPPTAPWEFSTTPSTGSPPPACRSSPRTSR